MRFQFPEKDLPYTCFETSNRKLPILVAPSIKIAQLSQDLTCTLTFLRPHCLCHYYSRHRIRAPTGGNSNGDAPENDELVPLRTPIPVIMDQCINGPVDLNVYSKGKPTRNRGIGHSKPHLLKHY